MMIDNWCREHRTRFHHQELRMCPRLPGMMETWELGQRKKKGDEMIRIKKCKWCKRGNDDCLKD